MRWAAGVEYHGARFRGWQAQQAGVCTVQEELTQALSRVADHPLELTCAGRTDAMVHASGQVVHFDSAATRSAHAWLAGCNSLLPEDISLRWIQPVTDDFHARFSATGRHYRYWIYNRSYRCSLLHQRMTWHSYSLDVGLMQQAAELLLGEHDFSAFRAAECQARTPIRSLYQLDVCRMGDLICIRAYANAFLHHMVRNLVGVLFAVGQQKQPPQWAQEVLLSCRRDQAGVTAPADGLYLTAVDYPAHYQIPHQREVPFFPLI